MTMAGVAFSTFGALLFSSKTILDNVKKAGEDKKTN
jgi:hypothetical protein